MPLSSFDSHSNVRKNFETQEQNESKQLQNLMTSKITDLFAAKNQANEDALAEANYQRRVKAVMWVDKEIRKLISTISEMAPSDKKISFGKMFAATANIFEALSGTLVAAKKRGVVSYDGQLLMQGTHDSVLITLVKESIEDSPLPPRETPGANKFKPKDFFNADQTGPQKCAVCTKTVYPLERLGAAGKVFHQNCFVCAHCKGKLKSTDFCSVNGQVFWYVTSRHVDRSNADFAMTTL